MHLYRADDAMVGSRHLRPFVAAEVEHGVALGCQRTDCPFCDIVVYRKISILQECKDVVPESVEIVYRLTQIRCRVR